MTTLLDVARHAGVSVSTASYVVTGTRPVGAKTRQRVLEAIEATGYTPNAVARALRSSRSRTVALVVPDIRNPYFTAVIEGVEAVARASGLALMFVNSGEDPEREVAGLRDLRSQRIDGLIIGLTRRTPSEVLEDLARSDQPVIFIDRSGPSGSDQVTVANDVGARVMVEHLVANGHRRIGMVAGEGGISSAEERLVGYRAGLDASAMPIAAELIIEGGSRRELARRAVADALRSPEPPDALIVGNNDMTLGALEAVEQVGLRIPSDLALVSLDDLPWGHLLASPLTAVVQPSLAVGREAMRLLLRRIQAPDMPPRSIRLRPSFVHRTSCGCPPRPRGEVADLAADDEETS